MTQTQRDISYGELAALSEDFDRQAEEFPELHGEDRLNAEIDFIDQYINGNDNPEIRIL